MNNIDKTFEYLKTRTTNTHASKYNDTTKLMGLNACYCIAITFYPDESIHISKIHKKTLKIIDDAAIISNGFEITFDAIQSLLDEIIHVYN